MDGSILGDGDGVGGGIEEGVQIIDVEDLDVDLGAGLDVIESVLVRVTKHCSDHQLVTVNQSEISISVIQPIRSEYLPVHSLPVENIDVAGPRPHHQEDEVSNLLSLGLEEVFTVSADNLVLDADTGVITEDAHLLTGHNIHLANTVLLNRGIVHVTSKL